MNTKHTTAAGLALFAIAITIFIVTVSIGSIVALTSINSEPAIVADPFPQSFEAFSPDRSPKSARNEAKLDEIKSQKMPVAPEDGNRMHLSLILPTYSDPLATTVEHWYRSGLLHAIAQRCHSRSYRTNEALYKERLSMIIPAHHAPALILQKATGEVVWMAAGKDIPPTDSETAGAIMLAAQNNRVTSPIDSNCPDGRCPSPYPQPGIDPSRVPNLTPWAQPSDPILPLPRARDGMAANALRSVVWIAGGVVLVAVGLVALLLIGLLAFSAIKVRG